MHYQEALSWIHSISRFGMNLGLQRIESLLGYLGDPHKKLQFLHIGGSNGKGSTAAFAASVLRAAGYRVGLYTSPYLEEFTDRMSVNGEEIPKERLAELVAAVKPLAERLAADPSLGQPTEFEVVTALALEYFAEQKPDIVVLEVGLGGRLDATNVVSPLVSAITTISLEHTQVLGDTVTAIAREKGGIIKKKTPLVTQTDGEALAVLEEICRDLDAPIYKLGREFCCEPVSCGLSGQSFHYYGLNRNFKDLQIPLLGEYQIKNAAVALAALELLAAGDFPSALSEESLRSGLASTRWPGRLEIVREAPLVVIDGAHNIEAFQGLKSALQQLFSLEDNSLEDQSLGDRSLRGRKMILVLGILADKNPEELLPEILPLADVLIITKPASPRAADPYELEKLARTQYKRPIFIEEKIDSALDKAFASASPEDLILIAGSLYLISEARSILNSNQREEKPD